MRPVIRRFLFLIIIFIICCENAQSQEIGTWKAYSSFRTVNNITVDSDGRIWCATNGGLFVTDGDSILQKYTRIDGMYRNDPTSMVYDAGQEGIWLGYNDGMLEFLNLKDRSFSRYGDIYRANRYNPRGINRLLLRGDTLYIATDFGVVLFSTTKRYVLETWFNLGSFDTGTAVNDIAIRGKVAYCATASGVAIGDGNKGDLIVPSNWDNYGTAQGLDGEVFAIGTLGNKVYASTADENLEWDGGQWNASASFTSGAVLRYTASGDSLTGISSARITILTGDGRIRIGAVQGVPLNSALFHKGILWVGTSTRGMAVIKDPSTLKVDHYVAPEGPYLNLFSGMNIVNGVFISGSSPVPGKAVSPYTTTGYYIYKNGKWNNYNLATNPLLKKYGFNSVYISTYNDEAYYFGSWGRGIAEHNIKSDSITIYNSTNGLEGISGSNTFVVITGLDRDQDGRIWAVSYAAPDTPLYYKDKGSDTWVGLAKDPSLFSTDYYFGLMIDSYGQKWISLQSPEGIGEGILLLDTGDLKTAGDDQSFHITTDIDQGYLPDPKVNAMVQDQTGEVWVGTDRGVVRFIFPDRIINGTANDRRAEFLRRPNSDSLLLRDLNATSIVVDAANRKWIGSSGSGLWLISAGGDSVLKHFTTQNSPLISDNIISLSIDGSTGTLYIATDEGLVSYLEEVKDPVADMKHLFIYPNPYSYSRESGPIVIDGLSDQTTVRVVTVDGRVVKRLDAAGGRVTWDGRDFNGTRLPTGVYLVVAKDSQNGDKGVGKVVIVR